MEKDAPSSSPRTDNAFAIEDRFNATDFPNPVRKIGAFPFSRIFEHPSRTQKQSCNVRVFYAHTDTGIYIHIEIVNASKRQIKKRFY